MKAYIIPILALAAAATLSCTKDQNLYTPATPVPENCQQVYISSESLTSYSFQSTEELSEMVVPLTVRRTKADKAASVPVDVTADNAIFNIPSTVEFAAGEEETTFNISVKDKVPGEYSITLALKGDEFVDPYTKFDGSVFGTISVDIEEWIVYNANNYSEVYGGWDFDVEIQHKVGTKYYYFSSIWGADDAGFRLEDLGNGKFKLSGDYIDDSYYSDYNGWYYIDYYDYRWWVDAYDVDYPDWYSYFYPEEGILQLSFNDYNYNYYYETITWDVE